MKVVINHKQKLVTVTGKRVSWQDAGKIADKFGYKLKLVIRG